VWIAASAGALFWMAASGSGTARAAGIGWKSEGPFQACLDAQTKQWIDARVELIVNEDPAASAIDDPAVAAWTVQALKACQAKAGRGDPASEQLFVQYMTHWRKHIDDAATEIRRKLRPD
jgi:hypothetical protein